MNCQHAQELFSDYIAQELDRALMVTLEGHVQSCEDCRRELASLQNVWQALDQIPVEEPPMFFHENLMSRLAQEENTQEAVAAQRRALWDWRALFRPRALAAAAGVLILALAGVQAVQTQRAALGPLDWMVGVLHPRPAEPAKVSAIWDASTQTIKVTLEPQTNAVTPGNNVRYTLQLNGQTEEKTGELTAKETVTAELSSPTAPAPDALKVTFSVNGQPVEAPVKISVPSSP